MREVKIIEASDLHPIALSIRQPWAWLILHAGKDVENRSWRTSYKGLLTIHASKKWGPYEKADRLNVMREFGIEIPEIPPLGCVVGTVEVAGCVCESSSQWFSGPYALALESPRILDKPISCRGSLGFFSWINGIVP